MANINLTSFINLDFLYENGADFLSSNVDYVCAGRTFDGDLVIGCSWGKGRIYWYKVEQSDIDALRDTVERGESVGSFMSEFIRHNQSATIELDANINDLRVLRAKTATSVASKPDLMAAFAVFSQAYSI